MVIIHHLKPIILLIIYLAISNSPAGRFVSQIWQLILHFVVSLTTKIKDTFQVRIEPLCVYDAHNLPGFAHDFLSRISLNNEDIAASEAVPFCQDITTQCGLQVLCLPFTISPLSLPLKLQSLPKRVSVTDNLRFDPAVKFNFVSNAIWCASVEVPYTFTLTVCSIPNIDTIIFGPIRKGWHQHYCRLGRFLLNGIFHLLL